MRLSRSGGCTTGFVVLLLAAGACAGDEGSEPGPPGAPPPVEGMAEPVPEVVYATMALSEVNASGVSGEVMTMHSDDAVVVILEVAGLPEEGEYRAHIHLGSCLEGGPVALALSPVVGLADGTGASTTTLEADQLDPRESYFIMVHGEGGAAIVCGDMEGYVR
jgi:hypothetical protein